MVSFGSIVKNEGYGILLCNPFVHSIHYPFLLCIVSIFSVTSMTVLRELTVRG